jgi:hypothetical protein
MLCKFSYSLTVYTKTQSVDEHLHSFSDYPRVTRDRDGKEVFDYLKILDWIKTWLEKEHGGNIPNPYRFGVGACISSIGEKSPAGCAEYVAIFRQSYLGQLHWDK